MFTGGMYDRLSEWTSNVSVLFLGSAVIPFFSGGQLTSRSLVFGAGLALFSLWLSLRLTRISGRSDE